MSYEKYIHYDTEDFILDDDFLKWVFHPTQESESFWKGYLLLYPLQNKKIQEAAIIIRAMQAIEPDFPAERLNKIYTEVTSAPSPTRGIGWAIMKIAAVMLLLVSIGGLLYYSISEKQQLPFEVASGDAIEKGKIILPDGTVRLFETEQTQIRQTATGGLTINNDTVIGGAGKVKSGKAALNQVIIPYGKRSEITLADGTRIWLNSGSQLSYPATFEGDSREVYLMGEAFFEVESDPAKPFHVITGDMKIRVTGTRFNITSYANDPTTQAVLVSGIIDAIRNKRFARSMELQPGERVVYNKQEESMEKDRVDVELYASWVNGYLIFDNEPVDNIFKKLERYYNRNILAENLSGQPTFTGKLNLADDLGKVLKNIAFSASFSVDFENDVFIIRQKI